MTSTDSGMPWVKPGQGSTEFGPRRSPQVRTKFALVGPFKFGTHPGKAGDAESKSVSRRRRLERKGAETPDSGISTSFCADRSNFLPNRRTSWHCTTQMCHSRLRFGYFMLSRMWRIRTVGLGARRGAAVGGVHVPDNRFVRRGAGSSRGLSKGDSSRRDA